MLGDGSLAVLRVDHAQGVGRGREAVADGLELLLEDLGDAGQDVDVLALDGREAEAAVDDQLRALGHLGHLQPGLVDLVLEVLADAALDRGVTDDSSVEAPSDALHRHVVVRRADAARGEHDVVAGLEVGDGGGDLVELVGHGEDATHRDADAAQLAGQERRVGVHPLPREDLVPDDQDTRRPVHAPSYTEIASLRKSLAPIFTFTTAGLPAPSARSSAGRISSGRSTHSPCPPRAWIIWS